MIVLDNIANARETAEKMVDMLNIKEDKKTKEQTIGDLTRKILYGETMNFTPIQSLEYINIIGGNPTIKNQVLSSLLSKQGVVVNVIHDFDPVYDEVKVPVKDPNTGKAAVDENGVIKYYKDDEGNYILKKVLKDRITELEFVRYVDSIGEVVKSRCKFTWEMAQAAQWDTKPNWVKMPAYMMMARCLSRGARLFGVLTGYDDVEMLDSIDLKKGQKLDINEDGELSIIEDYPETITKKND